MHLDVAAELSLRDTLCPTSGEPPSPRKKRKREADADVHSAGDAEFMPKTSPRVIEMQHHLKSELDLLSIYCVCGQSFLMLRSNHPIEQTQAVAVASVVRRSAATVRIRLKPEYTGNGIGIFKDDRVFALIHDSTRFQASSHITGACRFVARSVMRFPVLNLRR